MALIRLNFKQWREAASKSPQAAADAYTRSIAALPEGLRQVIAAQSLPAPDLARALQTSLEDSKAPLRGIPYLLQDLFDVAGLPTLCGAPFHSPFDLPADESCELYQRLSEIGACFFGKSAPAEFGFSLRGENQPLGDCPHPNGPEYIGGGGAGGCVRAVSGGLVPLAFGLDSRGGIRVPAAFQGTFAFRMSKDFNSRQGVFPILPSMESVGWVNHDFDDLCATLDALYKLPDPSPEWSPKGFILRSLDDPISPEIKLGLANLACQLEIEENLSESRRLREQLGRGGRAMEIFEGRELTHIHRYWMEEYHDRYSPELIDRIERGLLGQGAVAEFAERAEEEVRQALSLFFLNYDYLILPISPVPSPKKTEWNAALEKSILSLCAPASLALLPALVLPFTCTQNRHSAAQILFNPRKLQAIPKVLAKLRPQFKHRTAPR